MYLNLKCFSQRGENRASSRARFWKQGSGRGGNNVHVNLRLEDEFQNQKPFGAGRSLKNRMAMWE